MEEHPEPDDLPNGDHHWPIGRGTIGFESFYAVLLRHVPNATIALEVQDTMEVKMDLLRTLAAAFTTKQ